MADRSCFRTLALALATAAVAAIWHPTSSAAQPPTGTVSAPTPTHSPTPTLAPAGLPAAGDEDPFAAYDAGRYDRALEGFVDVQVKRPDDPKIQMNLGATYYKMGDFEHAAGAYSKAAAGAAQASDDALAAEAHYNLGNVAFRQGRLEEAVERYRRSLELDPSDEDAKFNLELTREEIRRRREEAQQRQQQQPQQQDEQPPQDGDQQQKPPPGDQQQQPPQQDPKNDQKDQGDPQQQAAGQGADQDKDGLPDGIERAGDNPTDPTNPDSDADGLSDGQEDANRNGRRDEGESDPNNPDSDADGLPDGQDPQPNQPQPAAGSQGEAGEAPPGQQQPGQAPEGLPQAGEMTAEEAARYLALLEEVRPDLRHRDGKGRPARPAKDW